MHLFQEIGNIDFVNAGNIGPDGNIQALRQRNKDSGITSKNKHRSYERRKIFSEPKTTVSKYQLRPKVPQFNHQVHILPEQKRQYCKSSRQYPQKSGKQYELKQEKNSGYGYFVELVKNFVQSEQVVRVPQAKRRGRIFSSTDNQNVGKKARQQQSRNSESLHKTVWRQVSFIPAAQPLLHTLPPTYYIPKQIQPKNISFRQKVSSVFDNEYIPSPNELNEILHCLPHQQKKKAGNLRSYINSKRTNRINNFRGSNQNYERKKRVNNLIRYHDEEGLEQNKYPDSHIHWKQQHYDNIDSMTSSNQNSTNRRNSSNIRFFYHNPA